MSSTFTTSTRTVAFTAVVESFQETRVGNVNVQVIPGGDDYFVDLGGRGPQMLSLQSLTADSSGWNTLVAQVGQSGTLALENVATHTAILQNVQRTAPNLDGTSNVMLVFLLTDV